MPSFQSFAQESAASQARTDSDIAVDADAPTLAVAMFRAGVPHWTLERPGVLARVAGIMGADPVEAKANFGRAKTAAFTRRRQADGGPNGFGTGTFPSMLTSS